MANHATFGYFTNNYYRVNDCGYVVIPHNANYKSAAITSQIKDSVDQAEIDIFQYHSDLISECNAERVAFMKEYLINEKIQEIRDVNNDYVIGVEYELYNKDGKLMHTAETGINAKYCNAIITSDVSENNSLEYRKGFVFDSRIEIQVPEISRYGIKNRYIQYPYILKIKTITVYGTVGASSLIQESNSQVDLSHRHFESHANYRHNRPDDLHFNNFGSHFLTNAKVGTSIIDQVVVPAVLETARTYDTVKLCEIPCNENQYTIKLDHKLNLIVLNIEVFVDNYGTVYDEDDINAILALNNPDNIPDDSEDDDDDTNLPNPDDVTPLPPTDGPNVPNDGNDDEDDDTQDPDGENGSDGTTPDDGNDDSTDPDGGKDNGNGSDGTTPDDGEGTDDTTEPENPDDTTGDTNDPEVPGNESGEDNDSNGSKTPDDNTDENVTEPEIPSPEDGTNTDSENNDDTSSEETEPSV